MPEETPFMLDHMELYVSDLEAMRDFYTGVLGFVVTDEGGEGDGRMVFLSRNPGTHHQLVLSMGRPPDLERTVINHISFRVPGLNVLRDIWERVSVEPPGPVEQANHGISWSLYFRDPEGNRLECFTDSDWYTPQPFRVPLDFSLSDAEIVQATEALCRARPGFMTRKAYLATLAENFPG